MLPNTTGEVMVMQCHRHWERQGEMPMIIVFKDQGYGRGGTPIFTDVSEALARVALYPTDEDGLGTCFGAAQITFALRINFVNVKHEEDVRSHRNKGVTRASDP